MSDSASGPVVVLYGQAIQEATRSGDQGAMREMEQKAQAHLDAVKSALDELRAAMGRNS